MNNLTPQSSNENVSTTSEDSLADRKTQVIEFVRTNADYYDAQFTRIGNDSRFVWTFNLWAGVFGPIWFAARGMWNWGLIFLIVETFALVQIIRGLFGDLANAAWERIANIEGTLELRRQQLASAIENSTDKIDVYRRTVESLENAIGGIRLEAVQLEGTGLVITLTGIATLIGVKIVQTVVANTLFERRFSDWLLDSSIVAGMPTKQILLAACFVLLIVSATVTHYSFPGLYPWLIEFPTEHGIRLASIDWVENLFSFAVINGEAFFDSITYGIRLMLEALEMIFVETPWMVIASFIILLTWLSAGLRPAMYSGVFLLYIGLLGFWEKSMTTRPYLAQPPAYLFS